MGRGGADQMKRQKAKAQRRSSFALGVGVASLGIVVLALVIWGVFQFGSGSSFRQIGATEAYKLITNHKSDSDFVVLDVRTPEEYAQGHLPEKTPMNLDFYAPDFRERLSRLDRGKTYLVYCRTGHRSGETVQMMRELGFRRVYDLEGGIVAWQSVGLPLKIEK